MASDPNKYPDYISVPSEGEILVKESGWDKIDLPRHSHSCHQVIHTLSGTLRLQVGEANYFVPERHIAWIPPDTPHELSSNNRTILLRNIYFGAESDFKVKFTVYNTTTLIGENLRFIGRSGNVIRRSERPEMYWFVISFFRLLLAAGEEYRLPLNAVFVPKDKRLQAIFDYMREHLSENIDMDSVASEFGLSVRNMSRLFHNENTRFSSYLNYQRVTRAIELLTEDEKSMEQIAYEVGFNTPNHFNRVFRQMMGTNPRTFFNTISPQHSS